MHEQRKERRNKRQLWSPTRPTISGRGIIGALGSQPFNLSTFQNNSFFLTQAVLSPSWKNFSQFFWNEILSVFHDLKCVLHGGSKMPTDATLHGALMLVRQSRDGTHLEVTEQLMSSCFILLFCFHHVAPWKTKSGCPLWQQATLLMNHLAWQRNPKSWRTAMNYPVSISLCIERMRSSHEWQYFQFHIFLPKTRSHYVASNWLGTHCVDQVSLDFKEIHLPLSLSLKCWD